MRTENWRKARALFWLGLTVAFVLVVMVWAGILNIPGVPTPPVNLAAYRSWVFVVLIFLSTKALLEVLKPVFRLALKSHVRYEADIFAYFQVVSYAVWGTALGLVLYVIVGGGAQEFGFLGTALVSAALIYVMQEPLLNVVGWVIVVTMRVYKLGDRIEVNQSKGYVVEISPMNTTIREFGGGLYGDGFTGRHVTIPNSHVLKGNVFNYTKDTPFVWDQIAVGVTYESDHKLAEKLILEAADDVVGPMMRENRNVLRSKYEFADLTDYISEEPRVGWSLGDSAVTMTLSYFCPVFAKGHYRTRLVKRILEKVQAEPRVTFAYPHMQMITEPSGAARTEKVPLPR
ncbi:MAG: mechanosensitive ion channel family protein [Methanobacteriota archaeon]